MATTKCCARCKQWKELSKFSRDETRDDGCYPQCKRCVARRVAIYRRTIEGAARVKYNNLKRRGNPVSLGKDLCVLCKAQHNWADDYPPSRTEILRGMVKADSQGARKMFWLCPGHWAPLEPYQYLHPDTPFSDLLQAVSKSSCYCLPKSNPRSLGRGGC